MSETKEQAILRWFEEVWNQGRRQTIDELLDPACVIHDGPTTVTGPEEFKRFFDRMRASFSKIHVTPHEQVSGGDLVCLRWSAAMQVPDTGKEIRITGMSMIRFASGRFQEAWQNWDMVGMMEQLGSIPPSELYMGSREVAQGKAAK
ncbi:MAG TPA: ester cyclase [Bryobacteraceae bacterium]|jgi:predicted SnoaL-like aldol condensation-catalyzing enzyme|nr:ester cyclase [Bryobacteraceae bacterium]